MDSKIKLADVSDVPIGKSFVVKTPNGDEIALFNLNGNIYALENACPHMGAPLNEGEIDDCIVTCPWHGWQFDVRTGLCENMPGDDARSFKISVSDHEIFLENERSEPKLPSA
jgi:nitrite reductase (NADH) small subunit